MQLALDVVGLIPVVGEPFDALNAGISFARGDVLGASLSLLALAPLAGIGASTAKWAKRMADAVDAVGGRTRSSRVLLDSLRLSDDPQKVAAAMKRAEDNVAAALETGFKSEDELATIAKEIGGASEESSAALSETLRTAARRQSDDIAKESLQFFGAPRKPSGVVDILTDASGSTRARVKVGGDVTLKRISADNARKIQQFADEFQVEVTVVGSRVNAGKTLTQGQSDWDFVINKIEGVQPTRKMRDIRKKAGFQLPKGSQRIDEFGNVRRGSDIQVSEVIDTGKPHVTFQPGGF